MHHAKGHHVCYIASNSPHALSKHQFCSDIACRASMAEFTEYQATIEAIFQAAGCVIG